MNPCKHFKVAAYVFAYYLAKADDAEIQRGIDFYKQYIHWYIYELVFLVGLIQRVRKADHVYM